MKPPLTQDALRRELLYVPEVGQFIRLKSSKGVKFGDVAGCIDSAGYVQIRIAGRKYAAGRLAFLWMTGAWPKPEVDHINGCRWDNRWANLREATRSQNCTNRRKLSTANTSGTRGVSWNKKTKKWVVQIGPRNGKRRVGQFTNKEDAISAYSQAAKKLFGPFYPSHPETKPSL